MGSINRRYTIPLILVVIYISASTIHSSIMLWNTTMSQLGVVKEKQEYKQNPSKIGEQNGDKTELLSQAMPQGCLSLDFDGDVDHLLSKYKQVYIIARPKAAGSTFNAFARECMASTGSTSFPEYDILNKRNEMKLDFRNQLELPSLLASHAWNPHQACTVMKHASKDSLIVFSHREETERLMSAIKMVTSHWKQHGKKEFVKVFNKGKEAHIQETFLMNWIGSRQGEMSANSQWTSDVYNCIRENRPNFVFMNYKQASKLQKLIAKHHCPEFKDEVKKNVAAEKDKTVMVELEGDAGSSTNGTLVSLDDWLKAKKELLELVLRMKEDVPCQGTMRDIEDALFACPDETLLLSGQSYQEYTKPFPF